MAEVGRAVVALAAVEAVCEHLVLDAVALQIAGAVRRAVAIETQVGSASPSASGESQLYLLEGGHALLERRLA